MLKDRQLKYIFLHFFKTNQNKRFVRSNIIDWAYEKLVQGEETTHICYLAGFTCKEADEKIETFWLYFKKALQELNVTIPYLSVADARNEYACSICRDYLTGLFSVDEALDLLYDIWFENNFAEDSAIKDSRFDVWKALSMALNSMRDGYGAWPYFYGLTEDNYEKFFSREAKDFIAQYCNSSL
jgi:hypothetical protein